MKRILWFAVPACTLLLVWIVARFAPLPPMQSEPPVWTFYDRHGEVLFTGGGIEKPLPVSDFFHQAVVAIEDNDFYSHPGVDGLSVLRALWHNTRQGEVTSGASTITMQLARLLYLEDSPRTLGYKIRQVYFAWRLEHIYTKEEILNLYLEKASFGSGTVGITQAADLYFSRSPEHLSVAQTALLIGMLPNPSLYNPLTHPENALGKRNHILERLMDRGILTQEEYTYWRSEPLDMRPHIGTEIIAPHFVLWVKEQLQPHIDPSITDIRVHTTLDADLYRTIRTIASEEVARRHEHNLHNAATIVLENATQEIRVMLGSIDFFDADIDGAVNMAVRPRQVGSTLKPFLYALAIEGGMSPASQVEDVRRSIPTDMGSYSPRNFDVEREYGYVRFREALVNSYNISAVWLLRQLGLSAFGEHLHALHLLEHAGDIEPLGYASVLGAVEAPLLDLTTAYSVFVHEGTRVPPRFFTRVEDGDGNTMLLPEDITPDSENIYPPDIAHWVTHALSDAPSRWRSFSRGNVLELDFPSAAKTGTSEFFRDNWVVGFSDTFTVGVWVGNPDATPLRTSSGVEGAGPIWNKTLRTLHRDSPAGALPTGRQRTEYILCRRPYHQGNALDPSAFMEGAKTQTGTSEALHTGDSNNNLSSGNALNTQPCTETVTAFLTDAEYARLEVTAPPPYEMAFPSEGDIFFPGSQLLLQTRGGESAIRETFYWNGNITPARIPNLPVGQHTFWAEQDSVQTPPIHIQVEAVRQQP